MTTSDYIELSGVLVSVIAMIISIVAAYAAKKQARFAEEQAETAKRQAVTAEEQVKIAKEELTILKAQHKEVMESQLKAHLKAYIDSERSKKGNKLFFLVVENIGDSEARNIDILLDNQPAETHPIFLSQWEPIDKLAPRYLAKRQMIPTIGTKLPSNIKITWEDDYKSENTLETNI